MTEAEWIAFFKRPEIPAFNARILEHPDADLPRLVFADWVEENCPHVPFVMALRRSIANPETPEWVPNFSMVVKGHELRLWRGRIEVALYFDDPEFDEESDAFVDAAWESGWVGRLKLRGLGMGQIHPSLASNISGVEWLDCFSAGLDTSDLIRISAWWQLDHVLGIDLRLNTVDDQFAGAFASMTLPKLRTLLFPDVDLTDYRRRCLANSRTLPEHICAQFRRPT